MMRCKYFILVSLLFNLGARAQKLQLGDKAPRLEPYEWIKGEPIKGFEKGKVYIIEMGATWCKPCTAAIPKLTKIAKEYKGEVEVVGLFVQEVNREPLNTPNPRYVDNVKRYVAKNGSLMDYHVAVDDPKRTIEKNWINAHGASRGLPQTFVVDKKGLLVAHFMGLDDTTLRKTIKEIMEGSYSIERAIERTKRESERNNEVIKYNRFKGLYVDGNGGNGDGFMFRSILSKYKGGPEGLFSISHIRSWKSTDKIIAVIGESKEWLERKNLQGKVTSGRTGLEKLYYAAYADTLKNIHIMRHPIDGNYADLDSLWWFGSSYGKYWHKPLIYVSNKEPFDIHKTSIKNRWNYEVNTPKTNSAPGAGYLQKLVQQDLKRFFGYEVSVETLDMPVYYVKASTRAKQMKAINQNESAFDLYTSQTHSLAKGIQLKYISADIRDITGKLAFELNVGYDFSKRNTIEEPFIDVTGIDYLIDFHMTKNELESFDKHDMAGVEKFLNRIGLYLEKGTKPMKVVVIRDPKDGILGPALQEYQNTQ